MLALKKLKSFSSIFFKSRAWIADTPPIQGKFPPMVYEGIEDHKEKVRKFPFKTKKRVETKETQKQAVKAYEEELIRRYEKEISGLEDPVYPEAADELYGEHPQSTRKYDKIHAKELYWQPRSEETQEDILRKISYLKEFTGPQPIIDQSVSALIDKIEAKFRPLLPKPLEKITDPDFSITDIYKSDPEFRVLFEELALLIKKVNYKLYPNIAHNISFRLRYKEDIFGLWKDFETELLKFLHNYSTIEIAKLGYAVAGFFPKAGSTFLYQTLRNIAVQDLPGATLSEIMHIYQGFRLSGTQAVHTGVLNQLKVRGQKLVQGSPEAIAELLYTYANCRTKKHQRKRRRIQDEEVYEAFDFLKLFENELLAAIPQLSAEGLTRVALALVILRLNNTDDLLLELEMAIMKQVPKLDEFQSSSILYAFSKINHGQPYGQDAFWKAFEPQVKKYWNGYSNIKKSRIMYGYTARAVCSSELKDKLFLPWVTENISNLSYSELANVAYGLMFLEVNDKKIWADFVRNVGSQKLVCPLIHYKAIKYARFYVEALFPEWNYNHYEASCLEAERYYNTMRMIQESIKQENVDIYRILSLKLDIRNYISFLQYENLFIVHAAFMPEKVGVMFQKKRDCLPDSTKPLPIYELQLKLLRANQWDIINLNIQEYYEKDVKLREEDLKKQILENLEKAKDKHLQAEQARRAELDAYQMNFFNNNLWTQMHGIDKLTLKQEDVDNYMRSIITDIKEEEIEKARAGRGNLEQESTQKEK